MHESAESDLIQQAKAGSKPAFSNLMASYEGKLLRFLVVRARTRADAEDAMQECFINAYRYIESYNPRWQFSTWLYRIALRELSKRPQPAIEAVADLQVDQNAPDPLEACIASDDRHNLWLLARKLLSDEAFNTLWLRYAEDLSVSETARAMGRPATWVKVVVHRAKKRLAARSTDSAIRQRDDTKDSDKPDPNIEYETLI